ncbi:hypothetical protein AJ85_16220 [Alkalihalobacillus alcalophilus ATCC 27647 = CGMCC 1.3604]|uniref:Spore coat protein n=1 Tax=Alkalihalobacillus alcalophilus ATCC 27647 = CGMCC 1.3604 TaxID=1218173 RepID=A0A094XAM6_ALKAL|nr:hypothetical protein [Alkalihalobacillus alcalophilus]KGA95820.1 hypothetical protein BALCAV_0220005 [Alkalihalobacillus alcalophilus ATCC 27647 = CGMCC 1.3604]MED1562854.1 hypothetical protein [Alkalihalobacillus alcalophilus]THG89603.1 hypothetical protein AJ85_16220 [Alkalihalobacillus alcalophilus ATCC 27647 = CGMCC 1.3604]
MQQQQNQGQAQQQPQYQEPPAILSTKDSLYLSDMLSWNLVAMKKAHFYAGQCPDPEIKQALENAGQMHKRHYEKILTHLQPQQQQQQAMGNQLQ